MHTAGVSLGLIETQEVRRTGLGGNPGTGQPLLKPRRIGARCRDCREVCKDVVPPNFARAVVRPEERMSASQGISLRDQAA